MSVIVRDMYSTVLDAGITAAIAAGTTGPSINITGFTMGSTSAAQGGVANSSDTGVDNLVYTGTASQIYYALLPDSDACLFRIVLDDTVGNFEVGQICLMIGSTAFSKSVLYQQQYKWKSVLPGIYGNTLTFDLVLAISDVQSCINLTLLQELYASLPEVSDETQLPNAATTIYNCYLVRNHTALGIPVTAVRRNGYWSFAPHRAVAGQGEGVLAVATTLFDSSVAINMAVYYDYSADKYLPADATNPHKFPIGVRTSACEITQTGFISRYAAADIWPTTLTPNTLLSVQRATPGVPGTADLTYQPYGYVVSQNLVYVDFAGELEESWLTQKTAQVGAIPISKSHFHEVSGATGIIVDPSTVSSLPAGSVVAATVISGVATWVLADAENSALTPIGILNQYKNMVVTGGTLNIQTGVGSWPFPLTIGATYYAGTGSSAGMISTDGEWILGEAVSPTMLSVNIALLSRVQADLVDMLALVAEAEIELSTTRTRLMNLESALLQPTSIPTTTTAAASNVFYGVDTGSANALHVASLSPEITGLTDGMMFIVDVAYTNTSTTVTAQIEVYSTLPLKRADGSALHLGDIVATAYTAVMIYNAMANCLLLQNPANLMNAVTPGMTILVIPATTLYVNGTTGSDSNNGLTPTTAFATIQACVNYVSGFYCSGTVTVNVAAGTYVGFTVSKSLITAWSFVGSGTSSCFIHQVSSTSNSGCGIVVTVGATAAVTGFTISAYLYPLDSTSGALLLVNNINVTLSTQGAAFSANGSGQIGFYGTVTYSGSGVGLFEAESNSIIYCAYPATATFIASGTVAFSLACAMATSGGVLLLASTQVTFSGSSPTGTRYIATINGGINTQGSGSTFFPGNSITAPTIGGWYL